MKINSVACSTFGSLGIHFNLMDSVRSEAATSVIMVGEKSCHESLNGLLIYGLKWKGKEGEKKGANL